MAFDIGDVVMLKSGGATMTVEEPGDAQTKVTCCWQNPNGTGGFETVRFYFAEGTLELLSAVRAREKAEADRIDRMMDASQRDY